MLETIKKVRFEEDRLFSLFRQALTANDPPAPFIGRLYTGYMTGFNNCELNIQGTAPDVWQRVWEMLDFPAPPVELPENCKFHFRIAARAGHDSLLQLRRACRTPGGLDMDWKHIHIPVNDRPERAQFSVLLTPNVRLNNRHYC